MKWSLHHRSLFPARNKLCRPLHTSGLPIKSIGNVPANFPAWAHFKVGIHTAKSERFETRQNDLADASECAPTIEPSNISSSFATKSAGSPELDFVRRHELNVKPKTPVAANLEPDRSAPNSGQPRRFRSLQAIYLKPLKRQAPHGVRTCDLQLRSYSVRNVEFFADFALRVAYYLGLPASGPVPLPRIVERWTVPRSNFIFKKSQENFERITLRRLIQIKDGQPEVMELWLAYLRKHQYYGVGMKANVWQFDSLGIGQAMGDGQVEATLALET